MNIILGIMNQHDTKINVGLWPIEGTVKKVCGHFDIIRLLLNLVLC